MLSLYQKIVLNHSTGLFLNSLLKTSTNTFLLNSKNIINKSCSQNQLRFESTSVKDKELKENVLWFDNVFPLKLSRFDFRNLLFTKRKQIRMMEIAKKKLLPTAFPSYFELVGIEPSVKEGGIFIKYSYSGDKNEIIKAIYDNLLEKKPRSIFNLRRVRMFEVEGVPFVEDVDSIYPSTRILIDFKGQALDKETLFRHFRKFGPIIEIDVKKNDDKARIIFKSRRSATSAKICLNDCVIDGTKITIQYDNLTVFRAISLLCKHHPKIILPVMVGAFIVIGYYVLDPIRVFFVVNKFTGRYTYKSKRLRRGRWNPAVLVKLIENRKNNNGSKLTEEQEENLQQIKSYLKENPETFILITGPTGSGKSELVKELTKDINNYITIDCEALAMQPDSNKMLSNFASQIGVFPTISTGVISNLFETLLMNSLGQRNSNASNTVSKFNEILELLSIAINKINDDIIKKDDKNINNHPVIIIKDYLGKQKSKHQFIYQQLAEWAANITELQAAHVIFVSPNNASLKKLSNNLSTSIKNIIVSDATPEEALEYVKHRMSKEKVDIYDTDDLMDALTKIGGRMQDLTAYIQKIKSGLSPRDAFNSMINETVLELRKKGFGEDEEEASKMKWSPIQFWKIVQSLGGDDEEISYDNIRFHDIFNGDDTPIRAMENSELITIIYKDGRPYSIRAYRPLYRSGFKRMMSDSRFSASMCVATSLYLINSETKRIRELENEIGVLVNILSEKHGGEGVKGRSNRKELERRIGALVSLIRESNDKCNRWQMDGIVCKNVLKNIKTSKNN
jgi:deoxyadenosine/deoxycytidine kinase